MARGRRGGGSRSSSAPAKRAPSRTPARAAATPPAPMQKPSSGGGMMSGIGSTIMSGMAFGTGSAIAHQAVGAVVGSMSGGSETAPAQQAAPQQDMMSSGSQVVCGEDKTMFYECLQMNKGDQQSCAFLHDVLKECQRNSTQQQMY